MSQLRHLLISFLILAIALVSFSPLFYVYSHTPPDRVYTGINRWSQDYYAYLNDLERGKRGDLFLPVPKNETTRYPSFIHEELVLMGHIARLFNLSSPLAYHLLRFLLTLILLAVSYYFICLVLPKNLTIMAFLFAFTLSAIPDLTVLLDQFTNLPIHQFTSWFPLSWLVELDIVRRPSLVPHYQIGSICFLLILIWIKQSQTRSGFTTYFKIVLASITLAILQPVNTGILILTLIIYFFIKTPLIIKSKDAVSKNLLNLIKPVLAVLVASLPVILYYKFVITSSFSDPLSPLTKSTSHPIPLQFLPSAIGPVAFLGAIGLLFFFPKYSYLLSSWILAQAFAFFYLYKLLSFEQIRALFLPFYLPLAIFSVLLLNYLIKYFSHTPQFNCERTAGHIPLSASRPLIKQTIRNRLTRNLLPAVYCFLLLLSLPSILFSFDYQIHEYTDFKDFSLFVFPTKNQVAAFSFLEKNTRPDEAVLTLYEGSVLIPALAGNPIALDENYQSIYQNLPLRKERKIAFLRGSLPQQEARAFVAAENVRYLYWGYQEKSLGGSPANYPFLRPVFQNPEVTIYKVE